MDPLANLTRQRELAAEIIAALDSPPDFGEVSEAQDPAVIAKQVESLYIKRTEDILALANELAELVQALAEWQAKGGFSGAVSTSGDQLQAIITALDAHDAEWAHRHVSKRPNVPEALRRAIDAARSGPNRETWSLANER